MKRTPRYLFVFLATASILVMVTFFIIRLQWRMPEVLAELPATLSTDAYTEHHRNAVVVDTFLELNKKAYGDLMDIDQGSGLLTLSLNNTNQLGSDYYNNNSNLKSLTLQNDGFEITDDDKNNKVIARFSIYKNNFVVVPNDVMISLMYKIYNK